MTKLLFLLTLIPVLSVSAHGTDTAQQKIVNGYLIQFEYNTPGSIHAGEVTQFNFELLNKANDEMPIAFDRALVQIKDSQSQLVFSGNLVQENTAEVKGGSIWLPAGIAGNYQAEAAFFKNDKNLAEASFDFQVEPAIGAAETAKSAPASDYGWVFTALGGFLVGVVLIWLIRFKSAR